MTTRRLAAIMAADIAGYSRLMHADEEGTHARFKCLMTKVIEPALAEHGGRIVKNTGDGFLAEFRSAVEAVKAALQFQVHIATLAQAEPEDSRIWFRVGIHLGDVIAEPHDIFGDGVNIAARLEALAEPGGVLVSGAVRETVIGRLSCGFEDLGEQALKNIARSMRVYRAVVEPAVPRPAHAVSDRPSIAVLPFQNIGGDPEQEYFADGMVEEIITGLSRVRWFFVVSRSSSFTYRGRAVDVRQVGRELGVRYVLEGSVRKSASRVRITGQLIDATNGQHIWADRFDGDLADVFELQDRVTESVVGAIEPNLLTAEVRRAQSKPTESLDAYDLYLRAAPLTHAKTRLSLDSAIALSRQALLIDPAFAAAKGMLVYTYVLRIFQGWDEPGDVEAAIALARECATEGWSDPVALSRAGHALAILAEEPEEGVALLKRAMHLNPNSSLIQAFAGFVYCAAGQPKPAIECLSRALTLNPLGPEVTLVAAGLGFAHLLAGRLAEALDFTERAMHSASDFHPALRFRIAVLMCAGRVEEGRAMARQLLAADPAFRLSTRHIPRGGLYGNALRDAGLPE